MRTMNARDVYNLSKEDIWNLKDKKFMLVFDDGEMEVTARTTIFSWYLGVYHRRYPNTPLFKHHHLGDRQIKKQTHLEILGAGLWDCSDAYGSSVNMEDLSLIAYQTTNEIFNDFTTRLKAYVSTIDITSFLDVMDHPDIKEVNDNIKPTQYSIDHAYHCITSTLTDRSKLVGNTVARMAKSSLMPLGQMNQCIGPRGFLTDIDSSIFPVPIITGYVKGLNTLHDSMIESRSASKSLLFAKSEVGNSEYFNRKMQLLASIVSRVHPGDCGSPDTIPFKVKSGDLDKLNGKYYKQQGGGLGIITKDSRELIGTIVNIRSPLKCRHSDSYGVCHICLGEMSRSIPEHTNIGHFAATILCELISQIILSTKHLDGSSKVDELVFSTYDSKFIRSGSEYDFKNNDVEPQTVIMLAESLKGKEVSMILAASEANNLFDLEYTEVENLIPVNISSLTEVAIKYKARNGFYETGTVPVSKGSRRSWLTAEALAYIKQKGWSLNDKGNYVVDMSDWDNDLPLFQLPMKHTNMAEYMKTIQSFVMGIDKVSKKGKDKSRTSVSIESKMIEFYQLISSKLNVNIAYLEVIILSTMIRSKEQRDYRLPRPVSTGEVSNFNQIMQMRSLGLGMAYQGQYRMLTSVNSFLYKNRPDSSFDNLLLPYPKNNPRS